MSSGKLSNTTRGNGLYHLLAIAVAAIWGTTFISSKVLIEEGLSPAEIMLLRFVIAYIGILFFSREKLWADSLKDELWMVLLGVTGGSLYFLLENTALIYTQASNVAIIIAATPLLTTLAVDLLSKREKINRKIYYYSLCSLLGVGLVVFNGKFILKLNALGDILTLGASAMWVIYSIAILKVQERYSSLMITRKIFFYGIVTLLPYFAFEPMDLSWAKLCTPVVAGNLIFLGVLASLVCYIGWNVVIEKLGAVDSTNYLYLNPIVALVTSYLVLGERITWLAILGTVLILLGVILSEKLGRKRKITP
ncbi:MAG: DMT family transporter [Alistipes sp.]|nr:DMT family transporter [Alistipes sp.]